MRVSKTRRWRGEFRRERRGRKKKKEQDEVDNGERAKFFLRASVEIGWIKLRDSCARPTSDAASRASKERPRCRMSAIGDRGAEKRSRSGSIPRSRKTAAAAIAARVHRAMHLRRRRLLTPAFQAARGSMIFWALSAPFEPRADQSSIACVHLRRKTQVGGQALGSSLPKEERGVRVRSSRRRRRRQKRRWSFPSFALLRSAPKRHADSLREASEDCRAASARGDEQKSSTRATRTHLLEKREEKKKKVI